MSDLSLVDWAVRPLKRYAQFNGRAPRAEYWWFYLGTVVIGLALDVVDGATGGDTGWLGLLFNLGIIVPTIAVMVRRLHDTDRSGWWLAAIFLPVVALGVLAGAGMMSTSFGTLSAAVWIAILAFLVVAITLFIFMVLPGTTGANRYGADPYRPDEHLEEIFA